MGFISRVGYGLLALTLLAGVIYSVMLSTHARFPDEAEYLRLASHLVDGTGFSMDGVHPTAMRPPGYPLFLAAIQSVGGGVILARIAQYFFFAGTVLLVWRICRNELPSTTLLMVTGVVLIYPVLFYTSATLYPQTLAGFLFVLAVSLLLATPRGILKNIATGLTFGALMLVVPTFALTLIVILAVAWLLKIIRWQEAILIVIGASLLVGIWTARNEIVFHRLVPFASNSGENLLIGNCENTTPYGGSGNIDRTHYAQEAQARGLDEFETDHFYQQAAISWIKQNPGRALVLYFEKTANYFNVYNAYAAGTNAEVSPWKQVVMGITYVVLLGLLAWRLAEWKRYPLSANEKFLLAVYILSAFTMAIFVTRIRYRLPYDYLVIVLVATHLSRRWLPTKST
jgi:hypothetical protein